MIKKDMAALKFEFKIFLWKHDLSKATTTNCRLPNNRPPWNKRPGWKIVKYLIIVLPGIIVLGGIFTRFFGKILTKLGKRLFAKTIFFLEWKNSKNHQLSWTNKDFLGGKISKN